MNFDSCLGKYVLRILWPTRSLFFNVTLYQEQDRSSHEASPVPQDRFGTFVRHVLSHRTVPVIKQVLSRRTVLSCCKSCPAGLFQAPGYAKSRPRARGGIASIGEVLSGLVVVNAHFGDECGKRSKRFCAEDRGFLSEAGQFPFGKPLTAASDLAVNILNKFYAPRLHKAAPKAELSSDDRIYVNMGGEITTAAPTGIAGTNVARVQLLQADPVSEPFSSKLEKNHEGYSGVVSLIGSLVADLATESQESKVDEEHSQQEYEAFMAESVASRDQKVKEIEETRAAVSASLVQSKEELAFAVTSAGETAKMISALHQSCDWLLQNFDTRKTARAGEIEALNNAKAVLAGADYSL